MITSIAHDSAHVREVDINKSRLDDDLGYAHHTLPQDVIRHQEGLCQGGVLWDDLQQLVVGHHDQRVNLVPHLQNCITRLLISTRACRAHAYMH
jgi:hypothetical protein